MICTECNTHQVIIERIELGLTTCLNCAQKVKPLKGYMSYQHKTAPVIQLVSNDVFKDYRKYTPYGRNTGRGSGTHRMMSSSNR